MVPLLLVRREPPETTIKEAPVPERVRSVPAPRSRGRTGRLLVAVLATIAALTLALPDAAGDEHEEPGLEDLLAPLAPDEEAPPEGEPSPDAEPTDPATPPGEGPAPEPAPGDAAPADTPPPAAAPPADAPPPEAAPAEAAPPAPVQATESAPAPRRPTAGSAYGPQMNPGMLPANDLGLEPPPVAPPDVAPPEAAPASGQPGPADESPTEGLASGERFATSAGPLPEAPGKPAVAILALVALGLAWFDRRYQARYRLPPVQGAQHPTSVRP